jgi:ATP-binding cassette subfamily F protein 3
LISATKPQVLVLDEPTNHLDIESREALVQAINEFQGGVILISHDRHLIELTADQLWLVADGRVRAYDGDIEDYRRLLLSSANGSNGSGDGAGKPGRDEARKEKPARQPRTPAIRANILKLRQKARTAEKELERLSKERASIAATLADEKTYRSLGDELDGLLKRHADLEHAIQGAETRWLAAEEALESGES